MNREKRTETILKYSAREAMSFAYACKRDNRFDKTYAVSCHSSEYYTKRYIRCPFQTSAVKNTISSSHPLLRPSFTSQSYRPPFVRSCRTADTF